MTTVTFRAWVMTIVWMTGVSAAHAADRTLYDRLGGQPGVAAIAGSLIDRVAADPITASSFEHVKLDRLKRLLGEQICALGGGPCRYSGASMKRSHRGLHITQSMFYRMVETLRDVLRERRVDARSTNELLRLLAPMKRDVVEGPR